MENIDYNIAESITGLITNQRYKQQFPEFIRPYIYENVNDNQILQEWL